MNFRCVPFHLLSEEKNIIVDGRGNERTSLTLSHWPGNTTPAQYKDDLSAQIVFRFLEDPQIEGDVEIVSNNHFDEDGLVSLWSMLNPDAIVGRLKLEGSSESSIKPSHFIDYVRGAFTTTKLGIG